MQFERVNFTSFSDDMIKFSPAIYTKEKLFDAWNGITLPERGTVGSAGYDIRTPIDVTIPPYGNVVIPSGIKAVFDSDEMETWCLQMYIRSSIGLNDHVTITNGTGIIDADYQFAKNDGDMLLALTNNSDNLVKYKAGDRLCQGVFTIHGLTNNDKTNRVRFGGVGSTGIE